MNCRPVPKCRRENRGDSGANRRAPDRRSSTLVPFASFHAVEAYKLADGLGGGGGESCQKRSTDRLRSGATVNYERRVRGQKAALVCECNTIYGKGRYKYKGERLQWATSVTCITTWRTRLGLETVKLRLVLNVMQCLEFCEFGFSSCEVRFGSQSCRHVIQHCMESRPCVSQDVRAPITKSLSHC